MYKTRITELARSLELCMQSFIPRLCLCAILGIIVKDSQTAASLC